MSVTPRHRYTVASAIHSFSRTINFVANLIITKHFEEGGKTNLMVRHSNELGILSSKKNGLEWRTNKCCTIHHNNNNSPQTKLLSNCKREEIPDQFKDASLRSKARRSVERRSAHEGDHPGRRPVEDRLGGPGRRAPGIRCEDDDGANTAEGWALTCIHDKVIRWMQRHGVTL